MSKAKPNAKRKLIDDLNASQSKEIKKSKTASQNRQTERWTTENFGDLGKTTVKTFSVNKTKDKINLVKNKNVSRTGKNNNAVPDGTKGSGKTEQILNTQKIIPIIQTRGMKIKAEAKKAIESCKSKTVGRKQVKRDSNNQRKKMVITRKDCDYYDSIDALTSHEIADGEIDHDGIELSIQGSDIDDEDFGEDKPNDNTAEADAEENSSGTVASTAETW